MVNNTDKIAQLKAEIEKLQAEQDAFDRQTPEEKLAITLHELLCHANHTDGCGWFYDIKDGIHNWNSDGHARYMHKACCVITSCRKNGVSSDFAINLLKLIKE